MSLQPPSATSPTSQVPPTPTGLASLPAKPHPSTINTARASLGPSERMARQPLSPRTGVPPPSARPTSELLGVGIGAMGQTPETEAIDRWFENLQNYEATLEDMAAASLDLNFKEELNAIEEWFRVLSEAERTAALYSLLQTATQVQIRFFITVLQQMSRSDPMTALLSPAIGGSMQGQMEAKLNQMGLKSPGLMGPSSPAVRNFSNSSVANRASFGGDPSSFLSPDSAVLNGEAASTLVNQRAKLKSNNAQHRISAPGLMNAGVSPWAGSLGQVAERDLSPTNETPTSPTLPNAPPTTGASLRPKSTDFAGLTSALRSPRLGGSGDDAMQNLLSPAINGNWASMVNTPSAPMFPDTVQDHAQQNSLDATSAKLATLNGLSGDRVPMMDDARKFRKKTPNSEEQQQGNMRVALNGTNAAALLAAQAQAQWNANRQAGEGMSAFGNGLGGLGQGMAGLGMGGLAGLQGMANLQNMAGLAGMGGMNPLGNMAGMNLNGMGGMTQMDLLNLNFQNIALNPGALSQAQAQLLAAQLAAANYPNSAQGLKFAGLQTPASATSTRSRRTGMQTPGGRSTFSSNSAKEKPEDDVDPSVLQDVPTWLRSLRLHKYTPNFEGMDWRDMVLMDEAALEKKGVAALGARRKMLKTFEIVRAKMGLGPEPGSAVSSIGPSVAGESDVSTLTPTSAYPA